MNDQFVLLMFADADLCTYGTYSLYTSAKRFHDALHTFKLPPSQSYSTEQANSTIDGQVRGFVNARYWEAEEVPFITKTLAVPRPVKRSPPGKRRVII